MYRAGFLLFAWAALDPKWLVQDSVTHESRASALHFAVHGLPARFETSDDGVVQQKLNMEGALNVQTQGCLHPVTS